MVKAITVVVPTLNAETYLHQCLASITAQPVDGLECIVVDGGSTDGTERIVREHADVRWLSCPGWNQSRSINRGFAEASGAVVAWLAADDLYVENALKPVLRSFEDPTLDALIGDCEVIGPQGEHLWWERPGDYDFRRLLRRGNYIAQPAVFVRRHVLERIGFLDESLENAMDFDLWMRLRRCQVAYLPQPLARFRRHVDSKIVTQQARAWRETMRVVRRYGGGWTPELAWSYTRCRITLGRMQIIRGLTGSTPLRPLIRGRYLSEHA